MKSIASLALYSFNNSGFKPSAYNDVAISESGKSSMYSSNHFSERCGCLKLGEPVSRDCRSFIAGTYMPS